MRAARAAMDEPSMQQETDMSPYDSSHFESPAAEELVPSRYAMRVGDIEVLVVSDGVLPLPSTMLAPQRRTRRSGRLG